MKNIVNVDISHELENELNQIVISDEFADVDDKIKNCSEFNDILKDIISNRDVHKMQDFIQHGNVSCYLHCYYVAYYTYIICKKLNLDYISAVRGAMLHDFFLYDWHTTSLKFLGETGLHAFAHPRIALKNANNLFDLNKIERDAILNHMWPVTLHFPKTKEGFIVSCMDKYSAVLETFANCRKKLECNRLYRYSYILLCFVIFRIF